MVRMVDQSLLGAMDGRLSNAGFFYDRKINNAIPSGTYHSFAHYAGFSIGEKF